MTTENVPADNAPGAKLILRVVVAAILIWGLYLIVGAFNQRPARAVVLTVCFAGFLGFWWAAFQLRKRRLLREESLKKSTSKNVP